MDDDYDDMASEDYFRNLFSMLMEENAVIRIAAGCANEYSSGHGNILISLPEEMNLRMRTVISLAFPHIAAEEMSPLTVVDEGMKNLPDDFFLHGMTRLLFNLIRESGEKNQDSQNEDKLPDEWNQDEDFDDEVIEGKSDSFTPVENLDLSIRSYNCLKRAGIHSVEKLQTLTDEDFRHIRNLGRKSLDEIRQKLADNPGTAKTTVARIFSGILYETGLLSSNELIEVGRADLVAKYEGQTANRVKDVFLKAKGKVLFIDEAYSLADYWEGDFGDEAINTIVQEMENNREDTIVIFAGYPDKMEDFFARNPGLRSRVPFSICFNDYTPDEMLQIVKYEAGKRGFHIDSQAENKVKSICERATGRSDTGNGRFCRNLVENAILEYAVRIHGNSDAMTESNELLAEDFSASDVLVKEEKTKNTIGFVADSKTKECC